MKLCEHCIRGIQSREPLFVGSMVLSAEESEEQNTPCEKIEVSDEITICDFTTSTPSLVDFFTELSQTGVDFFSV